MSLWHKVKNVWVERIAPFFEHEYFEEDYIGEGYTVEPLWPALRPLAWFLGGLAFCGFMSGLLS